MKISYVINTASKDPWSTRGGNPWRSAGYGARYGLLKEKVLPAALTQGFDEIIVSGCFEEGEGYAYVPVPPRHRDRRDALIQRELGARYSTGDVIVFGHDDHALGEGFVERVRQYAEDWDLLIPQRIHGITGTVLNNGSKEHYMGAHALVMRRWLWAQVPWTSIDSEWWDCSMTRLWREAGGKLVYADALQHIDVEAAEHET